VALFRAALAAPEFSNAMEIVNTEMKPDRTMARIVYPQVARQKSTSTV
jgi:hypothetical protein